MAIGKALLLLFCLDAWLAAAQLADIDRQLRQLFINGTTVLRSEYLGDGIEPAARNVGDDGDDSFWWSNQFETASVLVRSNFTVDSSLFSMADFDRLLTTTTGVDAIYGMINKQMRQKHCVANSSSDCPLQCHPSDLASEVSELANFLRSKNANDHLNVNPAKSSGEQLPNIGTIIADAMAMPQDEIEQVPIVNKNSRNTETHIFFSSHFIDSFDMFHKHYYFAAYDGDTNKPTSATSGEIDRQAFANTSAILKDCRARWKKSLSPSESVGALDGDAAHSEQNVEGFINYLKSGKEDIETAKKLLRRVPKRLKSQYLCFLAFYGEQAMFQPITGATVEAEMYFANAVPSRIEALEKLVRPLPYAGNRKGWRRNQKNNGTLSDIEFGRGLKQKANEETIKSLLEHHVVSQKMAPLRQISHLSGKTLVVRDAAGRHPLLRYIVLQVKKLLRGIGSASDVSAELIYEPPPKLSVTTIAEHDKLFGKAVKGANGEAHYEVRFSSIPTAFEKHDTIIIPLALTASKVLVTLQRSATHNHLPSRSCSESTGDRVQPSVQKENYNSCDAGSICTLNEAISAQPLIKNNCLNPKVDFYTHPQISSSDPRNETLFNASNEEKLNVQHVLLERPFDILYIPRGMIRSWKVVRDLSSIPSFEVAGDRSPLDGSLFLSLAVEPTSISHESATYTTLIQAAIRNAYFEFNESSTLRTQKNCHNQLNNAGTRSVKQLSGRSAANLSESNPFRSNITTKEMDMYEHANDQQSADTSAMPDEGGYMNLGSRRKKANLDGKSATSSDIRFPSDCFNEVQLSIVTLEVIQRTILGLRKGVSGNTGSMNQRHRNVLEGVRRDILRLTGADDVNANNTNPADQPPVVDPAISLKRWSKLVLGKVLTDSVLFETSPAWYQQSTPFRERMVNMGVSSIFNDSARNTMLTIVEPQCPMRASDIVKLLSGNGAPLAVEDITGAPEKSSDRRRSVLYWKRNNALKLASKEMRKIVIQDVVVKAIDSLISSMPSASETDSATFQSRGNSFVDAWLDNVAAHKHKFSAGAQYWVEFNTIMAASGAYDIQEIERSGFDQ